jgi:cullin 1
LAKLFHYVDRYYVKHQGLPTLIQQGLQAFKKEVYDKIKAQITLAVLDMMHDERHRGTLIDATLVTDTVKLYEAMGESLLDDAYGNDLESKFIESTLSYYVKKRDSWMENDAMSEYLIKVESVLDEERNRVCKYLNAASEPKLLRALEEELLEKVEIILLQKEHSGCRALLANDKYEQLVRPFRLFSRFETGIPPFATMVQDYIIDVGLECVHKQQIRIRTSHKYNKKYDSDFVTDLCAIHVKYLSLIKTVFEGHSCFQKALRNAFVAIVNTNIAHISNAELLSSYCDRLLKIGGEKLSYSEIEEQLEKTLQLFIYLTDKDLFGEIYRNQLAKRLLNLRSASQDLEKLMVTMLKLQCGTQFTSKIEGMLRDITDGQEEHQNEFVRMLQLRKRSIPLQFTAQVLTYGMWPTYKSPYVVLPSVMSDCTLMFSDWYETQHPTRKLTWNFSLGYVIVKATFGEKQYDLYLSTLQAIILNEFNGGHTLRLDEVAKRVEVEKNILKLVLHSLSCGKIQVLIKIPQGTNIATTDRFVSNSNFYSKLRKIRIPSASLDSYHNMKRINEDRSIAIEAAIVRIMKSRKTLDHKRLITETLSQLAFFQPNPKDVKYRIESLIEREYLKRNPRNSAIYHVSYE